MPPFRKKYIPKGKSKLGGLFAAVCRDSREKLMKEQRDTTNNAGVGHKESADATKTGGGEISNKPNEGRAEGSNTS